MEDRRTRLPDETLDVAPEDLIYLDREAGGGPSASVVTEPDVLKELDRQEAAGEYLTLYRAAQLVDGKLYPPMAAKVNGQFVTPIELGKWEQADEHPELADDDGKFKLDKGNGSSLKARYNPYIHSSPSPLNDQFSSAYKRPELVTLEVHVPKSELTSGYHAEKAKDPVGMMEWKAGVVQGKLSGTRQVMLSRWDKPVRIVPDPEVAQKIKELIGGRDITIPANVVTPSLRQELEKIGVPVREKGGGTSAFAVDGKYFRTWQDVLAQFKEDLKNVSLTPEQQQVYNAVTTPGETAQIRINDLNTLEDVYLHHGTRTKGAVKIISIHYAGLRNPVTAMEVVSMGDIIRRGVIAEDGNEKYPNSRRYELKTADGATLKLVIDNDKKNKKTVINLYSDRKPEIGGNNTGLKSDAITVVPNIPQSGEMSSGYSGNTGNTGAENLGADTDENGRGRTDTDGGNLRLSISDIWTGSAADYDKPSLHYVGTGEGAQVYGWGLYGTSEREVAEWYARADAERKNQPSVLFDGTSYHQMSDDDWRKNALHMVDLKGGSVPAAISHYKADLEHFESVPKYDKIRRYIQRKIDFLKENRDRITYFPGLKSGLFIDGEHVDIYSDKEKIEYLISKIIPESDRKDFRLEDCSVALDIIVIKRGNDIFSAAKNFNIQNPEFPRAEQVKKAAEAISEFFSPEGKDGHRFVWVDDAYEGHRHLYRQTFWPGKEENLLDWDTLIDKGQLHQIEEQLKKEGLSDKFFPSVEYGEELYKNLVNLLGSPKAASEFLYRAGIDGITYIGNTSDVRNYIAFSDKEINIDEHIRFAQEPVEPDMEDADARAVAILKQQYGDAPDFDEKEVAAFLKEKGFDVTPEEARVLLMKAIYEVRGDRARERMKRNAKQRDDWLYNTLPIYRHAVDFGGSNFKIKLDRRVARKDDNGSFLTRKNETGIESPELAKYIARQEGREGEENEIEEEIADFFRNLKKPDLYKKYYDAIRETREGEREMDRQAKEEYAKFVEDEIRDVFESGEAVSP